MSDYIKEKVGEWETKFGFFFVEGKEPDQMTLKKAIKEDLLQSLQEMEERTREEERERIAKAMQPAFDDFNAAAQRMIEVGSLKRTGTEIIENIGYMKSVLLSPSEEKEVVRWKNTFVKGHLENMEEASKLSELLFPVEEEKEVVCDCRCHKEFPSHLKGKGCPYCSPKKDTGKNLPKSTLNLPKEKRGR